VLSRLRLNSDAGSEYLSIRYGAELVAAGIAPSVGSVGDSYDNALAESIIGLYKTEVIDHLGQTIQSEAKSVAWQEGVGNHMTWHLAAAIAEVSSIPCFGVPVAGPKEPGSSDSLYWPVLTRAAQGLTIVAGSRSSMNGCSPWKSLNASGSTAARIARCRC
jgi:transposase InsO family protein